MTPKRYLAASLDRMSQASYSASRLTLFRCFPMMAKGNPVEIVEPNPALAGIIEAIWNWEDSGGVLPVSLPSPCPQIVLHYRTPMWSDRRRSPGHYQCMATGIQTGLVNFRRDGPAGAVLVRLRPETSDQVFSTSVAEFSDTNFALADIFGHGEVGRLQEKLAEAENSAERIGHVEGFLLRRVRDRPLSIVGHAASSLRRNPAQSVQQLASRLDISRRQLSRGFQAMFGASPKQYARIVRVGKVLVARRKSKLSWADTAYACGFTDQAHMVKDFKTLIGAPPEAFFRETNGEKTREWNVSLSESHFYNLFLT
jgi:AraC-like DNA-binding protein